MSERVLLACQQKAAESLRSLVNSDAVKDFIDSCGAGQRARGRGSSLVTWEGLFAAVVEFVFRECECILKLEREKPVTSGSALSGRKKLKQVSLSKHMHEREE